MQLITLLFSNPGAFVILVVLLLYSVIIHEIAHGWVAYLFGDDTAKRYGRLTLYPSSHLDPIGTIALFLVGFGWARPVPVNYNSLRSRFGLTAVALAGCLANILIAIAAIFLLQLDTINANPIFAPMLFILTRINIVLSAFNLIPLPPLDGSKILMGLLPYEAQEKLARIEPYGFYILIFLLVTGMLEPVIAFMQSLIFALIRIIFKLF
ncbi:MAG: site-2 protease family protein [Candidatus Omnitrophica bacterium]|nr:site-2 protease family protein [Candidatus Omnitrophota bacterium]